MRIIILFMLTCMLYVQSLFVEASSWNKRNYKKTSDKKCFLGIPQRTSRRCQKVRAEKLTKKMAFYKMTGPTYKFPFPLLDQPVNTTIRYFRKEKFHSRWAELYLNVGSKARNHASLLTKQMYAASPVFSSYENYTKLGDSFKDAFLAATSPNPQFKYAGRSSEYVTDLFKDERFLKDTYFAQLRLAGPNPNAIRRVTIDGKSGTNFGDLLGRLNTNFDWENAVIAITKDENIEKSIEENKVYVVEYPGLAGIKQMPDYLPLLNPGKVMRNNSAQIALFAVDCKKTLRVVAIQNSTTKDGHVYTPRDGLKWTISKAELHISDIFYAANVEHLLKTHFKMEPICVSMHRHLSILHPLHQILKYHCRGLIPLNAFGIASLISNKKTYRSLFSYGNEGASELLIKEYPNMVWDDVDLERNIQERGMDDREQLPYYPYRDDGRLLNKVFQRFASRLVNMYYKQDCEVWRDFELQNMIGELSQRRGSKHANKISKVKGLPSFFHSKCQLKKFIRQVLWIVVHHSVFSYTAGDYFLPPIYASKLYDTGKNGKTLDFIQMLPGPFHSILQAALASGVATLYYDSMFDYWKYLKSRKLKFLVRRAHKEIVRAQGYISRRNKRRYQRGQITNPYMITGCLTNSICT